ncbi:hypothetical protein [Streptomyces spongiae]|uniref:Extensin n=1 Tax=Streptomyces spongiae TaxID=565072 RepID=A0A5N8XV20_9ACTN|nr:hypothetical protein [Streptomyces spongiae]MPY63221.1 hypothetical protein [Streptomyces spongiae]
MADEQYKWLDREAAECLLRGEPLEALDADARAAADRLTEALDALTADLPPVDAELPGEEATLAAFRKARAERDGENTALSAGAGTYATARSADAGLVRLGWPEPEGRRARRGRSLRFGMAATLAAGMLGGVAVAAVAGVLPTPFRDDRPQPASTASAPETPELPLMTPSPDGSARGRAGEPSPGGSTGEAGDGGARDDTARGGGATGQPGSKDSGKEWRSAGRGWGGGVRSACRDVRDGKKLDSDRKRVLEGLAGGRGKVKKYCKGVLGDRGDRRDRGATGTSDHGRDTPGNGDTGSGRDKDGRGKGGKDKGGRGKDGGDNGGGDNGGGDTGGRGRGGDGEGSGSRNGGNDHRGNGGLVHPVSVLHHIGALGSHTSL